jgi:lipopolysaccharide/colanic/teichoic acid biosynthesis glycosyltransferase
LLWARAIDSMAPALRNTDVVGWFDEGAAIGVIRSGPDMDQVENSASLLAMLEREMSSRLPAADARHVRIRADVYKPGNAAAAAALRDALEPVVAGPGDRAWSVLKRFVDLAGATALLALGSPLMLAVAALVKWTSAGPVLVRQERIGQHGRVFRMLKFRTMRPDADHELHEQFVAEYIRGGHGARAGQGGVFKIVADPRVTPAGRFLRRSSLDELPQLWNVVKGDMSLVGPRPPLPYEVKCYRPWHHRRVFEAKPGITGLWQVTGRSRTTFDEMVRLDLRYAREQSLWTDLKILIATPRAVLSGEGAR